MSRGLSSPARQGWDPEATISARQGWVRRQRPPPSGRGLTARSRRLTGRGEFGFVLTIRSARALQLPHVILDVFGVGAQQILQAHLAELAVGSGSLERFRRKALEQLVIRRSQYAKRLE